MLKHLIIILLAACAPAPDKPDQADPVEPIPSVFADAAARLTADFVEDGWVCSRSQDPADETCQHAGDSLLWSGLWLGAGSCSAAFPTELMLRDMIVRNSGALVRHEPLGEYAGGREISIDGALGLYLGVAQRVKRCPETKGDWQYAVKFHQAFRGQNGGRLHPNVSDILPPGFDLLPTLLLARLSDASDPADLGRRVGQLMAQSTAWAFATSSTHAAAYRIHLAYVAIQTLEALDVSIPDGHRNAFCAAVRDADMPTVDDWCGRGDLKGWIAGFKHDEWEFRHQRSGNWEKPDGQGLRTPGLDLIVGIRQAYALQ
jgi:hypothetical protein